MENTFKNSPTRNTVNQINGVGLSSGLRHYNEQEHDVSQGLSSFSASDRVMIIIIITITILLITLHYGRSISPRYASGYGNNNYTSKTMNMLLPFATVD